MMKRSMLALLLVASEGLKNMDLYSLSGGITNPYPPHSSQYHQFNRTNYYWVVQ